MEKKKDEKEGKKSHLHCSAWRAYSSMKIVEQQKNNGGRQAKQIEQKRGKIHKAEQDKTRAKKYRTSTSEESEEKKNFLNGIT